MQYWLWKKAAVQKHTRAIFVLFHIIWFQTFLPQMYNDN